MTPTAADVARRTLRIQRSILAKLGAVQAVSFAGIGPTEDDIYQVKFDNGSAESIWRKTEDPSHRARTTVRRR